ncbi:helix-turn-helix domain-containing protein [uncultured Streptomyces sp.]|uniref:helix-turn-helix domain-containing protein n=1 Tax=uncultured Streptomyces sp. TaxID=174707 RepID=UPI00260D0929|nr:helix-turn-helix domain-containing protein [uncultured Streptomyces sp.]
MGWGDERSRALLDALLTGSDVPGLARRAATALDLPEHGRYAVVVLTAGEESGGSGAGPERRGPGGDGVGGVGDRAGAGSDAGSDAGGPLPGAGAPDGLRFFWRAEVDRETGVVALGDRSLDELTALLRAGGTGPGGVGPVAEGLSGLAPARRLAEVALLTCAPGTAEIARLDERLPAALMVCQPELSARLVEEVFGPVLALSPAERTLLLMTLEAWIDCGGSAGLAAAQLYCHRNTVLNRLRRLERLTSRALSRPRELMELTLALDALRLVPGAGAEEVPEGAEPGA